MSRIRFRLNLNLSIVCLCGQMGLSISICTGRKNQKQHECFHVIAPLERKDLALLESKALSELDATMRQKLPFLGGFTRKCDVRPFALSSG